MKYRIALLGVIGLFVLIGLFFPQETSIIPDDVREEFMLDTWDAISIITDRIYEGDDFTKDESKFILFYYKEHGDLSETEGEILWDVQLMFNYANDYHEAQIENNTQKQNEAMNKYENTYEHFKKVINFNY